jgi:outer membrane lipoprotein SlyB
MLTPRPWRVDTARLQAGLCTAALQRGDGWVTVTIALRFGYHTRTAWSEVALTLRRLMCALVVAGLSGCGPNYSPDTYSTNAVQQANKVEQGVIVGVRNVDVSATGAAGAITGAAAGGIAGAQVGSGPISALSALGGSLVGGLAGTAVEHATADTFAYEYIVRKASGELVSVTQKDKTPLTLGLHVLVIAGNQARIVPDYTVASDGSPKATDKPKPPEQEADKPHSPPGGASAGQSGAAPGAPISLAPPASTAGAALPAPVVATPLATPAPASTNMPQPNSALVPNSSPMPPSVPVQGNTAAPASTPVPGTTPVPATAPVPATTTTPTVTPLPSSPPAAASLGIRPGG